MEWNEILAGMFPLSIIFSIIIGYLAVKRSWKIAEWF